MLTDLRIRNFALIDQLTVRLGPGLNVLTGETGAGKSIIVGALSLLLGERASSEVVRSGADRASVEGVFEVAGNERLAALLDERGIESEEGILILKREVAAEGRSRAWVNGSPATAGLLGEIGTLLVDLHGQHEHQTLLRGPEQRAILDAYAGAERLVGEVGSAFAELSAVNEEIETLETRRRELLQRADLLRFQAEEIGKAELRPGEEEELEEAATRLQHAEELMALSATLADEIAAGDDALTSRLGALQRTLGQLTRIDPSQEPLQELFDTAYYALEELGTRLQEYTSSVEHDPQRLEQIRQRQDLIFRLCSKYGPRVEDVHALGESVRQELNSLDGADWEIGALEKRRTEVRERLEAHAGELSALREREARSLQEAIRVVLPELGMAGGTFEIALSPRERIGPEGREEVEFRVSLNRGFEPRPLAQVASGGELSRVMLAIKTVLARVDSVATLIFDEVDAGIGGRVALQVGEKMRSVAETHQVFAITHLPQIASRAHTHLLVQKREGDGRVATEVSPLEGDARVHEIARMLGGDPESRVSLDHARELLGRGSLLLDGVTSV